MYASIEECYERLKEDVLSFKEKRRVVLFKDFNARVGKSVGMDEECLERIQVMLVVID